MKFIVIFVLFIIIGTIFAGDIGLPGFLGAVSKKNGDGGIINGDFGGALDGALDAGLGIVTDTLQLAGA